MKKQSSLLLRRFPGLGLGVVALVMLIAAVPGTATAAHNLVTIGLDVRTAEQVTGGVEVKNTIGSAQSGTLHLIIFEVDELKGLEEKARIDLGTFDLAAGAGSFFTVPFMVDLVAPELGDDKLLLLAKFASSVNGEPVAHTHSSGIVSMPAEEPEEIEPPEIEEPE